MKDPTTRADVTFVGWIDDRSPDEFVFATLVSGSVTLLLFQRRR